MRAEALFPLIAHGGQALLEHRDVFVNGKAIFVFDEEDRLHACYQTLPSPHDSFSNGSPCLFLFLFKQTFFSTNRYLASFSRLHSRGTCSHAPVRLENERTSERSVMTLRISERRCRRVSASAYTCIRTAAVVVISY